MGKGKTIPEIIFGYMWKNSHLNPHFTYINFQWIKDLRGNK